VVTGCAGGHTNQGPSPQSRVVRACVHEEGKEGCNFAGTWEAGFSEQGTPPEYCDTNVWGLALLKQTREVAVSMDHLHYC
jgi:hypothetical protein